jgi:Protein of unknown function (DUF4236)
MGFRLWRRVRIAPGVTLNLSKSGLSTSFGRRGYHVTVGHGHIRNTVGIPGTGMYWTSVSGSGQRQTREVSRRPVRRAPPTLYRVPATPEDNRRTALTCLVLVGIAIAVVLTVMTSGLALIPIGLVLVLFVVLGRRHRNHQPGYLAQQLIKKAMTAPEPGASLALLHEAIDTDPEGKDTLLACATWFFDRQCWADAVDAYAGYLHIASTPYYETRHAQALIGAGHLDEAAAELGHLRSEGLDESDQALVLSQLALTFALKGDPGQGLAFANEAGLQKHVLSPGAQRCLMMRGICRYLGGQKAKGIEDIERLYAISSSTEVLELKTRMQNGTYQVDVPKPYPDWYPPKVELREGPVVEQVPDGHGEELAVGAASPDGKWRWSGSQWEPIPESEANVPVSVAPAGLPTQSTGDAALSGPVPPDPEQVAPSTSTS